MKISFFLMSVLFSDQLHDLRTAHKVIDRHRFDIIAMPDAVPELARDVLHVHGADRKKGQT